MSSDCKAKTVTATGALAVGPARIKAISFVPAASGTISIKDGSSSGTEILDLDVATGSTTFLLIPCDGIRSVGDPYITLTTVTSVTIFYA